MTSQSVSVSSRFICDERKKTDACFHCGDIGHQKRECPKLSKEAPGRTGRVSSLTTQQEELEKALAERKVAAEQQQLEGVGNVDMVTVSSVGVKGSLVRVGLEIEGLPIQAVVDMGAQCTVILRALLRQVGKHMRDQGKELPECVSPSVKLYGRGGESGSELPLKSPSSCP